MPQELINRQYADHRVYLAAALAAAAFSNSRRETLTGKYDTWDRCVEAATELSDALYQKWWAFGVVWGETHDQYDVLDRIAELWFQWAATEGAVWDADVIAELAIEASARHAANSQPEPRSPYE